MSPQFRTFCGIAGLLCLSLAASLPASADDGIFPPSPQAKPFIDFDGRGFLLNGQRTFLASGGMEFARVPRALWRDRLQRFQRAGMNTVEIYLFWNYHEPTEGKFDFSGNKDLDAFLKLVKQIGMYAIVRVGPYVCAEWDGGGYPVWLRFKPGLRVREDNPQFLEAVDRYFDKALPIVADNQISRGGSVILVQLENEHPKGWGTEMPNGYFRHLRDKALLRGIEVPYFFSGLHHSADPAGNRPWNSAGRTNPWFSTEFWPGWYNLYGPLSADQQLRFDRGTWKIIAYGGNGYNYYMLHGGTNFDYWNNQEDASSYDYGAAVGQAGDLRPLYYRFKRAAWFARGFQSVLEDSENASDDYNGAATNPAVQVTARRSPAGTILFLDNPGRASVQTQVKEARASVSASSGTLTLAPGEIMPVVQNYKLLPEVTLQWAPTRILGVFPQGETTTLVAYGAPGTPAELRFAVPSGTVIRRGKEFFAASTAGTLTLKTWIPANAPAESIFLTPSGKRVRILLVTDMLADRTWFAAAKNAGYVVCGPAYLRDARVENGRLHLETEKPWSDSAASSVAVYGPGEKPLSPRRTASPAASALKGYAPPRLTDWEEQRAPDPTMPAFDDRKWLTSEDEPLPMGADGDISAYAWYRTSLTVPQAGVYLLTFTHAADTLMPFLDGKPVSAGQSASSSGNPVTLSLSAGDHALAVFTSHAGRDKLFGYIGPLEGQDAKGLSGPVALRQIEGTAKEVTGWQILPVVGEPRDTPPAFNASGWRDYSIGDNAFARGRGFAWFQTTLPAALEGGLQGQTLHFDGVDDNATVYLNGIQIAAHTGWNSSFEAPLGTAWRSGQTNRLAVLVENTDGTGGIRKPVTLARYRYDLPVLHWKLRGGPGDPLSGSGWGPVDSAAVSLPTVYRAAFTALPDPEAGPQPILRVSLKGMSRGSVWLNGHNLGRYPEKVPVDGIYLPSCWISKGKNSLVIFDEQGNRPGAVTLRIETAASRISEEWTANEAG